MIIMMMFLYVLYAWSTTSSNSDVEGRSNNVDVFCGSYSCRVLHSTNPPQWKSQVHLSHTFVQFFVSIQPSLWLIFTPILTHSYIAPNISRFCFVWQSLDILCQHKAPERHHHPTPHHIKTLKCHDAKEHTSTQYIHTLYESIAK